MGETGLAAVASSVRKTLVKLTNAYRHCTVGSERRQCSEYCNLLGKPAYSEMLLLELVVCRFSRTWLDRLYSCATHGRHRACSMAYHLIFAAS